MQFTEALKLALQSLWGNKMRTILTLLGVVMGVASVIMVITMVNGANSYVANKLSSHGADVFSVSRAAAVIMSPQAYTKYQKRKIINIEDYEAVRDSCKECAEVGAMLSQSGGVRFNGQSTTGTSIRGLTWTMLDLNSTEIAIGRGFTPADDEHAAHSVIVGYDIVDNLLGDSDPIGKEIRVDGISYNIVGVGARLGKMFGQSMDPGMPALPQLRIRQGLRPRHRHHRPGTGGPHDHRLGSKRISNMYYSWSKILKEILRRLGLKSIRELVGRTDTLPTPEKTHFWIAARLHHAVKFTAADDVETRARLRQRAEHGQIAVRLDRETDEMIGNRAPCASRRTGL